MRDTGNQKKFELLGMPFGTANGRLRKILLFKFAQDLRLDKCFRCGSDINIIDEFSIEHKNAWMQQPDPQKAFFDISNIAFSHISCNVGAAVKINKSSISKKERDKLYWDKYYSNPVKRREFLRKKREHYHTK